MGQSPQPRETPNLVLIYSRQTDDCCGIGFPDSFPYQLQGRIDPDLWKRMISDINDAVAQKSSEVCCIVVSAFCIFCGGMCWIITQPARKRRRRIAVFEKYNNEVFRPRGMLLTYQTGYHNQAENIQRCYLQIDILQTTTTITTTTIMTPIPTTPPIGSTVVNCPQCQLSMAITPGYNQFQCPRCKNMFSVGNPTIPITVNSPPTSGPTIPSNGGYGSVPIGYSGIPQSDYGNYQPPLYQPPPFYTPPIAPSSPSAPPSSGEPGEPGSGPYTQSMY